MAAISSSDRNNFVLNVVKHSLVLELSRKLGIERGLPGEDSYRLGKFSTRPSAHSFHSFLLFHSSVLRNMASAWAAARFVTSKQVSVGAEGDVGIGMTGSARHDVNRDALGQQTAKSARSLGTT